MILHEINITAGEKEIIGIIGPNGCGKTTLLNAISGFIPVETGVINFKGKDIMNLPAHERAKFGIGRSFQHVGGFKEMTLEENLMLAIETRDKYPWWWMFSAIHKAKMD